MKSFFLSFSYSFIYLFFISGVRDKKPVVSFQDLKTFFFFNLTLHVENELLDYVYSVTNIVCIAIYKECHDE